MTEQQKEAVPPRRVKDLQYRCSGGIPNLSDSELDAVSKFAMPIDEATGQGNREIVKDLMFQIITERDLRERRKSASESEKRQSRFNLAQIVINVLLGVIALVSAVATWGSWQEIRKQAAREVTVAPETEKLQAHYQLLFEQLHTLQSRIEIIEDGTRTLEHDTAEPAPKLQESPPPAVAQ